MHSLLHATLALLHLPAKQIEWAKLTHITLEHRRSPPIHTYTLSRVGLLSRNTCWILQQLLCWSDCLRLFSCLLDIGLTWPEVLPICISIARAHTIDNLAGPAAVANFGNLFEPMCVRQQQAELCDAALAQFICHELVACLCLQFRRS